MTPEERAIIEEYVRRKSLSDSIDLQRLRDPSFEKQNEVLQARDKRYKAINCTRRSGKSVGEAIDHFEIAEEFPGSRSLYMGITLDSVSEIIWDVFKDLNKLGKYNCKFNNTKKIVFFPNGSRIRLFGLDVSERQMRKVLGQKLRKVSIDEAGSITIDMKRLCYQMIKPALADNRPNSWLTLLGTCENIPNTFFEAVTEGLERGVNWNVYKWTAYENPHMARQWKEEIDEAIENNPEVVNASWFRTHYLNEWCSDDDLLIIKLDKAKNYLEELPNDRYGFVLGVDLGYNDATAFSVLAYSDNHDVAFVVKSYKETQMDITDVANEIRKIQRQFDIEKIIVDGANKQGVEEIKNRHGIPLESADKKDKATFLRILRDDFIQAKVKILEGECGELITEWKSLMWKDEYKEKEDDRCQNHLSDATLYAWRYCYHYIFEPPEPKKDPNTDEYMDDLEEREAEEMLQLQREEEEWDHYLKAA